MINNNKVIQLTDNEIHIWMVSPKQITDDKNLYEIISQEEKDKVARFRLKDAKHTALITRAFIRLLLSQYVALSPQQWLFSVSDLGKPEVINSPLPLRFNLSHNNEMIICAVCLQADIGCDVENLSRKVNINAIVDRFFSQQEALRIKAEPTRFFQYWTLKEAFVKATGLGISQGLDTFDFEIKETSKDNFNDNINLSFNKNSKQKSPENWYQALLFPDARHCIGLSVNNKQANLKPNIHLFSSEQGATLFNAHNT